MQGAFFVPVNSLLRPRERLNQVGLSSLNDVELLALLLGTGRHGHQAEEVAKELLGMAQGCLNNLASWPPESLAQVPGIGPAKSGLIAAAMEIGRRRQFGLERVGDVIAQSRDVYVRFASRLSDLQHEEFWLLLLRRSNKVLAEICISRGGLTGTVADPKIIYARALAMRAAALVLVHNHPSGQTRPSEADRRLTHQLCQAGSFLDLPVLDHVIIAGGRYVSFADEGWLT